MSIKNNLHDLKKEIPTSVKLVVVSKTRTEDEIIEVYNTGHKVFGENRVQELVKKYEHLPKDILWHMIGHLQANKVKYIAPFISLIHSVDSLKLLKTINKEAAKSNRVIDCLLQARIAQEETKFGLIEDEIESILNSEEYIAMKNIRIIGLMGMATFTDNESIVQDEFRKLRDYFNKTKEEYFKNDSRFKELSMGMSGDYKIAIREGSTIVRVGSKIFA